MATMTADGRVVGAKQNDRLVIFASSLGTVFEWYDFYIYGTLGAILASKFFSGVAPTSAFIFTLLAFAAGFAVRPFGALVFGRLGDLVGRKYTFLVTMTLMGIGTFLIGVLPTYASIGIAAPILLIVLRLVQGLALGGEYGGAATYVAEHAPNGKRGLYTSWIQTTATLGLFMALLVILGIRTVMGEAAFNDWGWRIPFLLSVRPARRLDLDPAAARRVARVPEDEGRRHAVEGAAQGSLRQLGQWQDRDPRAARRHRR